MDADLTTNQITIPEIEIPSNDINPPIPVIPVNVYLTITSKNEKTEEQKKLDRIKRFGVIESSLNVPDSKLTFIGNMLESYNFTKYIESSSVNPEDQESKNSSPINLRIQNLP